MMRSVYWDMGRSVLLVFLSAVALMLCLDCLSGCTRTDQQRVENAAAVAQYDRALVDCKAKAKAAHDFEVFEACERDVARAYCLASEALRREWPHCKEVLP